MEEQIDRTSGKRPEKRAVLLVCFVVIGGLVLAGSWQKNNLKAVWLALNSDQQALQERQSVQNGKRQELLERYEIGSITDYLLVEQDEDLGVPRPLEPIASEEAHVGPTDTDLDRDEEGMPPPQEDGQDPGDALALQRCIVALYTLEDLYQGKLDDLMEETRHEFWSLPQEEQTKEKKLALVRSKMEELIAWEKECDQQVEQLLMEIQQVLDGQGKKGALVEEIRLEYEESKAIWKATCMTQLFK